MTEETHTRPAEQQAHGHHELTERELERVVGGDVWQEPTPIGP
jgi:hypothetical protein